MLNFRGLTMIYMAILPDCLVKFFAEKRILRAVTYGEGHPNLTDVRSVVCTTSLVAASMIIFVHIRNDENYDFPLHPFFAEHEPGPNENMYWS